MKKTFLILLFSLLLNFSVQADSDNTKCIKVKGLKEKMKCMKNKYESFRESVPKTGLETFEKINKKK